MLILIHGDDLVTSRKKMLDEKLKHEDNEIISFDGKAILLEEIAVAAQTQSLFEKERVIIIENLLFKKIDKTREKIISYIINTSDLNSYILWEGKEINKGIINKHFSQARVFKFSVPKILFKFLDSIRPSSTHLVTLFHSVLKQVDAELIFAMMVRQFRFLIIAKDLGRDGLKDLASWQAGKFSSQSRFFTLEGLISLYKKLLVIDYKIKSGKTPYSLSQLLDIYLITL